MPPKRATKKAPSAELFHEALGLELSQKLFALSTTTASLDNKNAPFNFLSQYPAILDTVEVCPQVMTQEKSLRSGALLAVQIMTAPSRTFVRVDSSKTIVPEEQAKAEKYGYTYRLEDMNAAQTIEGLLSRYGRMTHMGCRDHAYQFFLNQAKNAALSYRIINKVAVIRLVDPVHTKPWH
jgi:hypothetical protein